MLRFTAAVMPVAWACAALLFCPGCESQPLDYSLPQYGTRAVLDPHAGWGQLAYLQDQKILDALNRFFASHGMEAGLPTGLMVRRHPNARSLIYEWLAADGQWASMQQSARSSAAFAAMTLNMATARAQERDWGFVVNYNNFDALTWHTKAAIILHEFWHQSQQIHRHGTLRYWWCYSVQFVSKGYWHIDGEVEAHNLTDCFYEFLREKYNITRSKKQKRCNHCGMALPGGNIPEQD